MSEWLEKTPWPAQGIETGTTPEDYRWGYLYLYRDGRAEFLEEERPTHREIEARWGHYLRSPSQTNRLSISVGTADSDA